MSIFEGYKDLLESPLSRVSLPQRPSGLYDPIHYFLELGGKRLRPCLVLLTCELLRGKAAQAVDAAVAVELFHNFTLIHDDIMDKAPLRRGRATVHSKWNENTAILSGDAMLVMAYSKLNNYRGAALEQLFPAFNEAARWVCEGQQLDIDYETQADVQLEHYLEMIRLKTAVLLGASMKIGAIIAGASATQQAEAFSIGENLGMAFQLQDDYLDAFGDPEKFGKRSGGDIQSNKKTYLFLQAVLLATAEKREELKAWYANPTESAEKVQSVKEIFVALEVGEMALAKIQNYYQKANSALNNLEGSELHKETLREFAAALMVREF